MIRLDSPTCGAASPTPGAAYMVCTMLSISPSTLPLIFLTGAAGSLSVSSGNLRIFSSAIFRISDLTNLSKGSGCGESERIEERFDGADTFGGTLDLEKVTR